MIHRGKKRYIQTRLCTNQLGESKRTGLIPVNRWRKNPKGVLIIKAMYRKLTHRGAPVVGWEL